MDKIDKIKYDMKADILKAVAHRVRIIIVEKLSEGEQCVCELNKIFDLDTSTVSKHLTVLKKAGIVESEKRGLKVFYKLRCSCILTFFSCIEKIIQNNYEEAKMVAGK